jgi:glycosyltransferase involved in cell wall biosynthesis
MSNIGILALATPDHGGSFQYTLSMIEALLCLPENRYTLYTVPDNRAFDRFRLPIVPLPSPLSVLGGIARTNRVLVAEVEKVIAPIYSTYLLLSSRPFAFTLHDLQERYYPENFSIAQRLWRRTLNGALARRAARIVCETGYVKDDIVRFCGVPAKKVVVVPTCPITTQMQEELPAQRLDEVCAKLQLPDQFIFYPAQFWPHKNHLRLVEAFAEVARHHPQCHLLLTGKPRGDCADGAARIRMFRRVCARVIELGLEKKVRHVGYVSTSELNAIYKTCTLVVVPTLFESISLPVYEAFALGAPVCASRIGALPEQIGDAGVLFDPFSVPEIALTICAALADEDRRRELVRRGKAAVAGLTREAYAARLRSILTEVAPGGVM